MLWFSEPLSFFIRADCTICFNSFNQRSWLWCLIGHFHLGVSWIAWWFQKESMSEDKLGKWDYKKWGCSSSPRCSILSVACLPQTVIIPPHFLHIQSSGPPTAHRARASSVAPVHFAPITIITEKQVAFSVCRDTCTQFCKVINTRGEEHHTLADGQSLKSFFLFLSVFLSWTWK